MPLGHLVLILGPNHPPVGPPLASGLDKLQVRVSDRNHYRKVPKFSDTRNFCCKLLKIQTNRQNLRVFHQKDANGIENSEDPDQTAPLGAD